MRENLVWNSRFPQGYADHRRPGHFSAFADGVRNFPRLSQAHSHFASLVTHDDQRAEIESASTLHDFRRAIDEHDLLDQLMSLAIEIHVSLRSAAPAARTAATARLIAARLIRARLIRARLIRARLIGTGLISTTFYFGWFSHKFVLGYY
jgi:hypothetical protein